MAVFEFELCQILFHDLLIQKKILMITKLTYLLSQNAFLDLPLKYGFCNKPFRKMKH